MDRRGLGIGDSSSELEYGDPVQISLPFLDRRGVGEDGCLVMFRDGSGSFGRHTHRPSVSYMSLSLDRHIAFVRQPQLA